MKVKRISRHAHKRYAERTGRSLGSMHHTALTRALSTGSEVHKNYLESRGFSIVKTQKGDRYVVWMDEFINEELCAIISKDMTVKTILTKDVFSYRELKAKRPWDFGGSDNEGCM